MISLTTSQEVSIVASPLNDNEEVTGFVPPPNWYSSDPYVASVHPVDGTLECVVKGQHEGTATISCTINTGAGTVQGSVEVVVNNGVATHVSLVAGTPVPKS